MRIEILNTLVMQTDGKVFFKCERCKLAKLAMLKTVERLFVQVLHLPHFSMYGNKGLDYLLQTVESVKTWQESLQLWRLFQDLTKQGKQEEQGRDGGDDTQKDPYPKPMENDVQHAVDSTLSDAEFPTLKKRKVSIGNDDSVTFRISCKCVAKVARRWAPKEIAKSIGVMLSKKRGWTVDLKSPEIEILVQINSNGLVVGMPVTRHPLSDRPYMHRLGLRSPVAWIMGHLAQIEVGHWVLDPMCGAGTLLIEAAQSWPGALYCGSDVDSEQLLKAEVNVQQAQESHVDLLLADVKALPIARSGVDRVICDVPFGINHSTRQEVKQLYPVMLAAMDRVLKPGGRVVILVSSDFKDYLITQVKQISGTAATDCIQTATTAVDCIQTATTAADCIQTAAADCIQTATTAADCIQTATTAADCIQTATTAADIQTAAENNVTFPNKSSSWILECSHYLKLGNTHAHVCVFNK